MTILLLLTTTTTTTTTTTACIYYNIMTATSGDHIDIVRNIFTHEVTLYVVTDN